MVLPLGQLGLLTSGPTGLPQGPGPLEARPWLGSLPVILTSGSHETHSLAPLGFAQIFLLRNALSPATLFKIEVAICPPSNSHLSLPISIHNDFMLTKIIMQPP